MVIQGMDLKDKNAEEVLLTSLYEPILMSVRQKQCYKMSLESKSDIKPDNSLLNIVSKT